MDRRRALIGLAAALVAASPAAAAEPCFQPAREFSGIWINEFEGSRFIENGRSMADVPVPRTGPRVWLDMEHSRWANNDWRRYEGHAYRIRFRGRAACDMNRETTMMGGYGHFGMSNGLVVVDYLSSTISGLFPGNRTSRSGAASRGEDLSLKSDAR